MLRKVLFTKIFEDCTKDGVKIKKEDYLNKGLYPIIDQGQEYISGYSNKREGLYDNVPAIIFGDHTRIIKYIETPFFLGADGVKLLKSYHSNANYKYLYYALKSAKIPDTGYNRHFKWLKEIEIPFPSIQEQDKISKILDKTSDLISLRKSQIEKLDLLIKSQFVEMFGNQGNEFESKTLQEIVSKDKNALKRGPFGGSLKKEDFVNNGYLIYEQRHAIHSDFKYEKYYITEEKYLEMEMFKVEPYDLLVSCSGVTLGRISEVPNGAKPGIINQALLKITLNNLIMNNLYFINLFRSEQIQNILFDFCRGSGIPNFPSMSEVKQIKFLCPPIELQNQFASFVKQIDKQKIALQNNLSELNNLYNALMQKYFD